MPKVIFIEHNGAEHAVEAEVGKTIMQAATENLVPGIVADCGGYCNCATCHCYIAPEWAANVPGPGDNEAAMLECALDVTGDSRLSCQVVLTEKMEGIVIRLPASQT